MRYPGGNGDVAPQSPHVVGPTWAVNEDGSWHLPEKTLGWGVLRWLADYVNTPGGHDDPARLRMLIGMSELGILINENMFLPTDEQSRMILWWYAVDNAGQYSFREGVFRRLKGHGKDPFAAALAVAARADVAGLASRARKASSPVDGSPPLVSIGRATSTPRGLTATVSGTDRPSVSYSSSRTCATLAGLIFGLPDSSRKFCNHSQLSTPSRYSCASRTRWSTSIPTRCISAHIACRCASCWYTGD